MGKFRGYHSDPQWLFPPRPGDLIPDDDLVWVINDVVDTLDLTAMEKRYSHYGAEAFMPRLQLKLLMYGYSQGILSARRLAWLARREAGGMVLAGGQTPSYSTISRFRKNFSLEIADLFHQVLAICIQMGMVSFGELYLDGSKIRANASKRKANTANRLEAKLAVLRQEVEELLLQADAVDEEEDAKYGAESDTAVPDALHDKQTRIEKIEASLDALQARAAEEDRSLQGKDQINFTDQDSRIMKTSNDGFQQCYNAQAVVDPKYLVIVAADVTQQATDYRQLIPMLQLAQTNLGRPLSAIVADAGYHSCDNLNHCVEHHVDGYIPLNKEAKQQQHGGSTSPRRPDEEAKPLQKKDFVYDADEDVYRCPRGEVLRPAPRPQNRVKTARTPYRSQVEVCQACPLLARCVSSGRGYRTVTRGPGDRLRDEMYRKLRTPEGQGLYAKRKYTVEPVFGLQKAGMGFGRFSCRGLVSAKTEYLFVSTVHNVKRIWHAIRNGLQWQPNQG